jgi:hypothetical protein
LVGEGGDDVEALLINKGVLGVSGGPVEGTGAEAINLDLVVPDVLVEGFEVLVQDQTVLLHVSWDLLGGVWMRTSCLGTLCVAAKHIYPATPNPITMKMYTIKLLYLVFFIRLSLIHGCSYLQIVSICPTQ